jgi:hypothetical protein
MRKKINNLKISQKILKKIKSKMTKYSSRKKKV